MAVASSEYSFDEGKTVTVEFKRVGGSAKKVTVSFQTAPGTAVHGKNYEDVTKTLIFEAGDSEPQFIDVKTIYHEELTGDLKFYEEIVDLTDSAITGFNHSSTINIIGIQNHKKLSNEKSLLSMKHSNPLTVYILTVFMAVVAVSAIVALVIIKKHLNESQDQTSLNNVEKIEYTK